MSIVNANFISMSTIDDLYEAFSQVNLRDELPNLILATSYEIDALVISQLDKGQLSTGEKITPSYASSYYAKKKETLNQQPGYGVPDIHVTGKLYAGIGVAVKGAEYDIESNVPYAQDDSIVQYGDNLLRLSDPNMTVYAENILFPAIANYITSKTGIDLT